MGETGVVRFPGSLDPAAQEFRPGFINAVDPTQIPFVPPPPLYYPYGPQGMTFYDGSVSFGPQYYNPVHAAPQPTYVAVAPQPALPPQTAAATRVLLLSSVAVDVSETTVRRELEVFGEVRGVQMERLRDGIVTVHFYDLRAAERALWEIREQHMQQQSRLRNFFAAALMAADSSSAAEANACAPLPPPARGLIAGRAVWAHFIVPASNAVPDGNNQGTIVVFNLDPGVSSAMLEEIFKAFGPVKELRETPLKKHQRFVEFYDVRDAAKALREMNGKEINGRQIVIEFSRPGGYSKKFYNYANNTAVSFKTLPPINDYSRNAKYVSPPSLARKFPGRLPSNIPPRALLSHSESFGKKSTICGKGNPNGSCSGKSSLEASLASNGLDEKAGNSGGGRKNGKMSQATVSSKPQHPKNRPWKCRQLKKYDARFLISEEAMNESSCRDSRTTIMVKNIPNKYSQKLLLNMLDNHCIHCNEQIGEGDAQPLSSYDFVYLPIDFNNKCNVGYGFVNMTSPEATWRLYKAFHHQHWEVFNSRKICEVTYARVQGLEALKEHFRNSKFPCEMEHYLPVVFSPPRDGKQLSEPQPIVGNRQQPRSNNVSSGPSSPKGRVEEASDGGESADSSSSETKADQGVGCGGAGVEDDQKMLG